MRKKLFLCFYIKDSGREVEALSKGIMWMMAAPFGLCCLCYTLRYGMTVIICFVAIVSSVLIKELLISHDMTFYYGNLFI